jgi:16S rRNA (cytosine1402-N4)-methyltransferase
MEFSHKPVLLETCIEYLNIDKDSAYADGTLGGGGHASAICERLSEEGIFIGIDRDGEAIEAASSRLSVYPCRKEIFKNNFSNIKELLRIAGIDGIAGGILDLGVSSYQLDNPERGFSYSQNAPLDMRMDKDAPITAEYVVNNYAREDLSRIIKTYGEERFADRIASGIVRARKRKPLSTTGELEEIIRSAIPAATRRTGPHPAKRTFQAIRIEVNNELEILEEALDAWIDVLRPGGRLLVISFHSLEDRIVKNVFINREDPFKSLPKDRPLPEADMKADARRVTKKAIMADDKEIESNPRARSARLRVLEKI